MKLKRTTFLRPAFLIRLLMTAFLLLGYGCRGDTDIAVVDFSKKRLSNPPGDIVPKYPTLRVAVAAMVSPAETFTSYRQLLDYMGGRLEQKIQFIQRKTYTEINELLSKGEIDLGFICSGPYVFGKDKYRFEAIAVPEVRGKLRYRSYLIVNKQSAYQSLGDLRDKTFGFTDPESNTGKLVPVYWLQQRGEQPESFFLKTIFTYSHDNSILAVAKNMVDGAAVHEHIWEYFNRKDPFYTSKTRVIMKSEPFGNPPVVCSSKVPEHQKIQLQRLLTSMHRDPDGKRILDQLLIDRFREPELPLYAPIVRMMNTVEHTGGLSHETNAEQS